MTESEIIQLASKWPHRISDVKRLHDLLLPAEQNENTMNALLHYSQSSRADIIWLSGMLRTYPNISVAHIVKYVEPQIKREKITKEFKQDIYDVFFVPVYNFIEKVIKKVKGFHAKD